MIGLVRTRRSAPTLGGFAVSTTQTSKKKTRRRQVDTLRQIVFERVGPGAYTKE